jgi:hypothetical protein
MTSTSAVDPLQELRQRLRNTGQAARELADQVNTMRDQGEAWTQAEEPGTDSGETADSSSPFLHDDLQAVIRALQILRSIIPLELQQQLAEIVREVLRALRALIDWVLDRESSNPSPKPAAVEEIPVS